MAKTYTSVPNVATGDVYTASSYNTYTAQNINNLRVPPMCRVYRSSDLTGYSSGAAVTWNAEDYDTDGMFTASSTDVTIQTDGIYLITLYAYWTAAATVTALEPAIRIGGTTVVGGTKVQAAGTGSIEQTSGVLKCVAGNVITGTFSFTGGSAYVIKGNASTSTHLTSWMTVHWLGQVS